MIFLKPKRFRERKKNRKREKKRLSQLNFI